MTYKDDHEEARWFREKMAMPALAPAAAAANITIAASSSSSGEPTAESDLVWRYVQQLIADGLRAVIRWREEEGIHGAAPVPKISDAEVDVVVNAHLREFSSSSTYDLYGRSWSIHNSIAAGLCQYRYTDQVGTRTAYYKCNTCATQGHTWEVCQVNAAPPSTASSEAIRRSETDLLIWCC
jgi:hypothetical protein